MSPLIYAVLILAVAALEILLLAALAMIICGCTCPRTRVNPASKMRQIRAAARSAANRTSDCYLRQVLGLFTKDIGELV